MTTFALLFNGVRRSHQILERLGALMALAGLSAAAAVFYQSAYQYLTKLQQIGPEELVRAFTGI